MKLNFILIVIYIFLVSCSNQEKEISTIKKLDQSQEMVSTYKEGYEALEKGDTYFAAKNDRKRKPQIIRKSCN